MNQCANEPNWWMADKQMKHTSPISSILRAFLPSLSFILHPSSFVFRLSSSALGSLAHLSFVICPFVHLSFVICSFVIHLSSFVLRPLAHLAPLASLAYLARLAPLAPLARLASLAPLALLALAACAPAPARIVVQWTTATEINTAGFNVYRSERAEGPYTKLNAQLIPASDALTGGKYQYEDTTVVAGKTYYYQLEDVEYGGATARHGPIVITASGGWGQAEWWMGIGVGALVVSALLLVARRARR
jgi:hypothetical protein